MDKALAAQYLRVSTERQEYSLDFQSARIASYALEHNFSVCRSYVDEAKSGLGIKQRGGLAQLLRDVIGGKQPYRAVLVYDVSRWGRFQDPDEAAAYEFLCKAAGVQVQYCAEHFHNDGYMPHVILKSLKRVMAGEYSRELSEKVLAAQLRAARDGFWVGGPPGYGFRRMLISSDNTPKGELKAGEWKSISNERTKLILGPPAEIHWVREIYRMYICETRSMEGIRNELNRLQVPPVRGRKWNAATVGNILTNQKYKGTLVFNRRSFKLQSPKKINPEAEWIVIPNAHPAIVDPQTFDAAQEIVRKRSHIWSSEQLLEGLKSILQAKGRLSVPLLRTLTHPPARGAYTRRFGSLIKAFELAGYDPQQQKLTVFHRQQYQKVRTEVMNYLLREFPGGVSIQSRGVYPLRNYLRLKNGTKVAVRTCCSANRKYKGPTWVLPEVRGEERMVTLLIALNAENTSTEFLYVMPPIANRYQVLFSRDHSWFEKGIRLNRLSLFCNAVQQILRQGKRTLGGGRRPVNQHSEDARAAISKANRIRWNAIRKLSGSSGE